MPNAPSETVDLLIYRLENRQFAIGVEQVDRVIQVVAVTPLIDAPSFILGIINLEGHILPVVGMRKKFEIASRNIVLSDQIIIAYSQKYSLALLVDQVVGLETIPWAEWIGGEKIFSDLRPLAGAVKLDCEIICIYDIDKFINLADQEKIDRALVKNKQQ